MTFYNNFTNFNMSYLFSGLNNWFTPTFSCFNMPFFSNINYSSNIFDNIFKPIDFTFNQTYSPGNNIWNWNFNNYNPPIGDTFSLSNKNKTNFSVKEYDSKAGEKLVKTALRDSIGFNGECARYVKRAIQKSGLGEYKMGHAYQMTGILRKNKNFKEISSNTDVSKLPSGCIIVYNKGSQGYSSQYGHVEITTGDGRAVSDGITKKLYKKPDAIFVPIKSYA